MADLIYKPQGFMKRFASVGRDVEVFNGALILKPEVIKIGDGTRIDDFARIEGGQGIQIGKYVHIASFASIMGGGEADLADISGLAQGAKLITGTGYPFEEKDECPYLFGPGDPVHRQRGRIVMETLTFVAVNAVVLPGVTIHEGGVVGAGSVVHKDVPPWTIVFGVPARVIGKRKRVDLKTADPWHRHAVSTV